MAAYSQQLEHQTPNTKHQTLMKLSPESLARFVAEIPDAAWLEEHGYSGPQQFAYSMVSDAHKDAHGIRPRWMALASVEECAAEYFNCVDACIANEREQQERELAEQAAMAADEAAFANAFRAAVNPARFGLQLSAVWPA